MRNSKTHSITLKRQLNKCKTTFYAYSELQYAYGSRLDSLFLVCTKDKSPLRGASLMQSKTHNKMKIYKVFYLNIKQTKTALHIPRDRWSGFGVALNVHKSLKILTFSLVSTPFPLKTVCRRYVWKFLMLYWCYEKKSAFHCCHQRGFDAFQNSKFESL